MTACCDTDVTVFGHVSADCPDTQVPAWEADAYTGRIRALDALAQSVHVHAELQSQRGRIAAHRRADLVRSRLSQLARSRP